MNKTKIPTPRTDAFKIQQNRLNQSISHDNWPWQVFDSILNFARQLERENIDLQSQIDDLTARSIHTCGDHCQRPNCVRRRENEKMREAIREASKVLMDILKNYECGGLIDSQCETTLAKLAPFLQ